MANINGDTQSKSFGPEDPRIWLKSIPDPPLCFCDQQAKPIKTKKCGVALACAQKNIYCGFHIHLQAWNEFREQIKRKKLDPFHPELAACPLFNFTFCTIFHIKSQLKMDTPTPPLCKCSKPMVLHMFRIHQRFRTVFVCYKRFEKDPCDSFFHAEDVLFERADGLFLESFTPEKRREVDTTIYGKELITTMKTIPEKVPSPPPYQNVVTRNTIQSIPKPIKSEINHLIEKNKNQVIELYTQQRDELASVKQDLQTLKETVHRLEILMDKEQHFRLQFKQENEDLSALIQKLVLQIKLQDDMKCVVCFQNQMEVAVVPCFHFAYCHECANKLVECAVCRTTIERTQRIYMS